MARKKHHTALQNRLEILQPLLCCYGSYREYCLLLLNYAAKTIMQRACSRVLQERPLPKSQSLKAPKKQFPDTTTTSASVDCKLHQVLQSQQELNCAVCLANDAVEALREEAPWCLSVS
jgi:hypothetical protein